MTIQYASDLHLEFQQNRELLKANPLKPEGDVLLPAGDVVPFAAMDQHKDFFSYVSDHFETTWWIPGNHEYYGSDITERRSTLNESIRPNVHLVNNTVVRLSDFRFIFSTLWSRIQPGNGWWVERGVSDFRAIKWNGHRFSAEWFNELHEECLNFITSELATSDTRTAVVITHHVPTLLHYPARFKGSALNNAFAVELFDLIESRGPDYWIYGHHHHNHPGFSIGKTQLLTNQLGYVAHAEHGLFDAGKTIW